MKKSKILISILFVFLIGLTFSFGNMSVKAEDTAVTGIRDDNPKPSIYTGENGNRWHEGILTINNRIAYCGNYAKHFSVGLTYTKKNAVDFLASETGISKTDAQEIITELALYITYLDKQNLTAEQKYYFGQVLVWRKLNSVFKWFYESDTFWIETPQMNSDNYALFGNTCGSEDECVEYERDVYRKAESYADNNKKKYKGYGTAWDNGVNQPLLEFKVKRIDYDYSIDAACEDCKSTGKNGTYQIQDTNDWEAIFASTDSENKNAQGYYKKTVSDSSCQIYCREEFNVVFPNASNFNGKNAMNIEPGRYFTVNQVTSGYMFKTGVFNFAPIKINKTRQCRALGDNQQACLQKFVDENTGSDKKYTYPAAGHSGRINLSYKDKNYSIKDTEEIDLEENTERSVSKNEITESPLSNSESKYLLTSTSTKYFELPDDLYSKFDSAGKAYKHSSDIKSNSTEITTDMGMSVLPISFNNYDGAKVSLQYSLPAHDSNSLMYSAFNKNNDYFGSKENSDSNLYQKDKNNDLDDNEKEQVKNSACAKLYVYGTAKYKTCRNARTTNKAGKCYDSINNKYTCELNTCPEGEKLCDNGECSENDKCTTPKCEIVDNKYYDKNGNVVSKEEFDKVCSEKKECKIENGKYYGKNGKEVDAQVYYAECLPDDGDNPKCKIITINGRTYYYNSNGEIVTKEEYKKDCEKDNYCTTCNGGKCCPDTDMVCPDENGNCPTTNGGRKIIYRTIDLGNPFPSINGTGRDTGANWCSYNVNTKKVNCSNSGALASGNTIVYKHILNNRSTDSKNIYSSQPLYSVTLNSSDIDNIKKYNAQNEYNNATLSCKNKICKSKILRSLASVSGKCSSSGYDNLKTCAEEK